MQKEPETCASGSFGANFSIFLFCVQLGDLLLVDLHQFGHAGTLGGGFYIEAIRLHHSAVVILVGLAKLRRHGQLVVQVGQAAVRVEGAGVENGPGGLLDFGLLGVGGVGPGEVVVDDVFGVAIIAF